MEMFGLGGERLGKIGTSQEEEVPEWKKTLLSKPSVSKRKGIAWVRGEQISRH